MPSAMNCLNCYYSNPVYGADGCQRGIECGADNMRFLEIDVAEVVRCGRWSETED